MDITKQSSLLNDGLKEKKVTIVGATDKDKEMDIDLKKAMELQEKISDILIEDNVTIRMAYTVCLALAESLYHYMLFGDNNDNN